MNRDSNNPEASAEREEDRLLFPDQFQELNKYFYETTPYSYFRHRWQQTLLFAGSPEEVDKLFQSGVNYGGISLQFAEHDSDAEAATESQQQAVLDSEVLLHHVSETLLRLYVAHSDLPPCPWLTLSRLRSFSKFKSIVRRRFQDSDPVESLNEIQSLFVGVPRDVLKDAPDTAWESGPPNIEAFLRHYAREILDGASLYNAAKHGLALRSADSAFSLGDSGKALLKAEGPALTFLEVVAREGSKRWARAVEWVDIERNLVLVEIACQLLECLWVVAKWRYTGEVPREIRLFETPRFEDVVGVHGISVEKLAMDLTYYKSEHDASRAPQEIQIASRFSYPASEVQSDSESTDDPFDD